MVESCNAYLWFAQNIANMAGTGDDLYYFETQTETSSPSAKARFGNILTRLSCSAELPLSEMRFGRIESLGRGPVVLALGLAVIAYIRDATASHQGHH